MFILPRFFCLARRLLQIKNPSLQQILVTGTEYLRGSTLLDHKNVTRLNGYLISLKAAFFRRLLAYTVPARFGGGILGLVIATHYYM
ncbi:MAG: hypothetical protein IKM73_01210 [Acidaminococcaceae bacterium]|nr:hypothetical protein [Acidaminococcaceae bacterium]